MTKNNFLRFKELRANSPPYVKINPHKISFLEHCEWCGLLFVPRTHRQKFCSDECFADHRRKYKRDWKRNNYQPKAKHQLGSGWISETANTDFEKEARIIRNEKKRLRL